MLADAVALWSNRAVQCLLLLLSRVRSLEEAAISRSGSRDEDEWTTSSYPSIRTRCSGDGYGCRRGKGVVRKSTLP